MMNKFVLMALAICSAACAQAQKATIFYTDLTSGPVGAVVTAYGTNLSNTATVNGQTAQTVLASPTKLSFVVPNTTSGSIAIGNSNSVPFTVRAGHIYYVAQGGSDSQNGSKSAPWATIPHGFYTATCGDVVYVMNGVSQTTTDDYNAALAVEKYCTAANPVALVGYPGAVATVGSATGPEYGIRNPDVNGDNFNGIVLANLRIRGGNEAISVVGSYDWRIVGNDIQVPSGGGESGVVLVETSSRVQFLGNNLHDSGAGGTKYYHSFYATTNSNHIEVGWNTIQNNKSCRGVQFYSTSGSPQYDLSVHDNVIHGQECDGINFSTIDATRGPVTAYNNLVYHVGLGGATDGLPNYACIASLGYGASGGSISWTDNTVADCGPAGGSTAGAFTAQTGSPTVVTRGNLVIQNPGEVLYSPDSNSSLFTSSNNVVSLKGPSGIVDSTYHLVSGSPAVGAGMGVAGIFYDLGGLQRPQSGASDAGVYLSSSSTVAPPPPPPPPPPVGTVSVPMHVVFTATLSDGSQVQVGGTLSFTAATNVTGISAASVSMNGTMPSGATVSATSPLTF